MEVISTNTCRDRRLGVLVPSPRLVGLGMVVHGARLDVACRLGDPLWKRSVECALEKSGAEHLVARPPVSRDIGKRVGDELYEPVHRDDEAISVPEESDTPENDGKGYRKPCLS
mmetsp:Transcript_7833/g.14390  ORF Transcript_7833/g.14390 Transcript_7833/m.14390 type:complete len:114 (-) Transcript_7833:496-837(-)